LVVRRWRTRWGFGTNRPAGLSKRSGDLQSLLSPDARPTHNLLPITHHPMKWYTDSGSELRAEAMEMKCPNCSTNLDDGARFCSSCGITIDRERPQAPKSVPKRPLIAAMIVILLLLAAAGLFALLHRGGDQSVVQTPGMPPATRSVVQTPAPPGPTQPMTQVDVPPPPSMPKAPPPEVAPPEVVQYIEFVKSIEAKRKDMRVDFNPAMDMLKNAYGAQLGFDENTDTPTPPKVSKGYQNYTQQWNQLVQTFNTVQAPEPCRQLAGAYSQALGNYVGTMTKIQVALVQNDMNTLMALHSKAQVDIDDQLKQADSQLAQLTTRYRLAKTFSITPDKDVGTILGQ
jgi:hypothetical protein